VTASNASDKPASPPGDGGLVSPHEVVRCAHDPAGTPKTRLRLDIAYDGTDFSGWARQPGLRTVQQVVEDAIATISRLTESAQLTVAGRTDAGVHATGQVAHVDLAAPFDVDTLPGRLNSLLPDDVVIRGVAVAPPGFDARFAALGRRYAYRVCDGSPDPLRRRDTVSWSRPLDADAMHDGAQALVGEHDFAAYCKPREGATTIRTLHELSVRRDGDTVEITAHADAFCHNQVRSMVGALLAVGDGRRPVRWPREVLAAGIRDSAVQVAPSHGLTLVAVDYPAEADLAARVTQTRRRRDST
jgi:tRNA pseudouridine38-40 synthase